MERMKWEEENEKESPEKIKKIIIFRWKWKRCRVAHIHWSSAAELYMLLLLHA